MSDEHFDKEGYCVRGHRVPADDIIVCREHCDMHYCRTHYEDHLHWISEMYDEESVEMSWRNGNDDPVH